MTVPPRPPRWAERLAGLFLPSRDRDEVLGDLHERFDRIANTRGVRRARMWYATQSLRLLAGILRRASSAPLVRPVRPRFRSASSDRPVRASSSSAFFFGLADEPRRALRRLRRAPLFAGVAISTVVLGVAAVTATFSVLDAVLLEPLPYDDPDELVSIWSRFEAADDVRGRISGPELDVLSRESRHLESVGVVWPRFASLTGGGEPEQVDRGLINGNFFRTLRAEPFLGRLIEPEDDVPGRPPVLVITHRLWERRYASDPALAGGTIQYNGMAHRVVGVLPPDFRLRLPAGASLPELDVYEVWGGGWDRVDPDWHLWNAVARLADGSTIGAARDETAALVTRLKERHAGYAENGLALDLQPLHDDIVAPFRAYVVGLFIAALFVGLVAWANAAALVALRVEARRKDLALCTALGATPLRIGAQVVSDIMVIFTAGSVFGWFAAGWTLSAISTLRPAGLEAVDFTSPDFSTAVVTAGAVLIGALAFGALPAVQAARSSFRPVVGTLRAASRSLGGRALVVGETALGVMLMVGAGLLLRTYVNLSAVDLGFEPGDAMTARVSLPSSRYPYASPESIADFYRQLEEGVAGASGVTEAGLTDLLPLGASTSNPTPYAVRRGGRETEWGELASETRVVTAGFFPAAGFRLRAGRVFDDRDGLDAPLRVVVDETLARRHWPDGNAVGQAIRVDLFLRGTSTPTWGQIVGVVAHARNNSLVEEGRPQIHLAHRQSPRRSMTLVVQTAGDPTGIATVVREEVRRLDAMLPIFDVRPFAGYVDDALAPTTLVLRLLALFTTVAVGLALVGLFAVTALHVRGRTGEIGIRLALGADGSRVRWLYARRGWTLGLAGTALGLAAAMFTAPALRSMVYGVSVFDPWSFAVVGVAAGGLTLLASYLPARAASGVNPIEAIQRT